MSHVEEASEFANKLMALTFAEEDAFVASRGLEVAAANLRDYCYKLERKLLARFEVHHREEIDLSDVAECAKILSKLNKGTSTIMQHYVVKLQYLFMTWKS
ncbi:putative exocyst complex component Sec10 [Rosa chinensis]|uniref:Putative exocyst complex component Sec10 n=1 Tax=Rosa chinensis TaxID=74649 RepID=A0A2P6SMM9_ROSCH|nr:putative exocyst complex component Sec10 [Rosa chinensis]